MFAAASRPAKPNDRAVMISPNLPGRYRCLKFWVHRLGEKFGSLNIHFNTAASMTSFLEIPVFSIVGSYGNSWKYMQVDVNVVSVFQVRKHLVQKLFLYARYLCLLYLFK